MELLRQADDLLRGQIDQQAFGDQQQRTATRARRGQHLIERRRIAQIGGNLGVLAGWGFSLQTATAVSHDAGQIDVEPA